MGRSGTSRTGPGRPQRNRCRAEGLLAASRNVSLAVAVAVEEEGSWASVLRTEAEYEVEASSVSWVGVAGVSLEESCVFWLEVWLEES